ncbi:hypothetical protein A0J61_10447 [Choanephora cucurbitarum]|uniref:Uncharacterized protein n=1 Tax=Choanephora cucurbitarum TaxID=101091 RepID=A0A1C7MXF8_9FUNG|nr:hypothetical protein A0J61_10447 [Choanephora cucurbitarum]
MKSAYNKAVDNSESKSAYTESQRHSWIESNRHHMKFQAISFTDRTQQSMSHTVKNDVASQMKIHVVNINFV